jgi:hypothetical protein
MLLGDEGQVISKFSKGVLKQEPQKDLIRPRGGFRGIFGFAYVLGDSHHGYQLQTCTTIQLHRGPTTLIVSFIIKVYLIFYLFYLKD